MFTYAKVSTCDLGFKMLEKKTNRSHKWDSWIDFTEWG